MNEFEKGQAKQLYVLEKRHKLVTKYIHRLDRTDTHLKTKSLTNIFSRYDYFQAITKISKIMFSTVIFFYDNSVVNREILGIMDVIYQQFSLKVRMKQQLFKNIDSTDHFCSTHQRTIQLLQCIDMLSADILEICVIKVRRKWHFNDLHASNAIVTQNRFDMLKKQIKHQLVSAHR